MLARTFNSVMPRIHERYVGRALDLRLNPEDGIDLIGERAQVEVKFRLIDPEETYPKKWVVQDHQMKYPEKFKELTPYWCLGFYRMNRAVSSINNRLRRSRRFEPMVTQRVMYLVTWDWMRQYDPHLCTGETEKTQWENMLRYARGDCLPKVTQTFPTRKGPLHLTEGVNVEDFPILVNDPPF